MAFNPELEVKSLRARVDGLERKVESQEKILRELPDLSALAKLGPRLEAAEKAIAGKKDAKTAEQEALKAHTKLAAEMQALGKDVVSKAMLDVRFKMLEGMIASVRTTGR